MGDANIICGDEIENPIPVTLGEVLALLLETHSDKVLQVDASTGQEYKASYILDQSKRLAQWLDSQGLRPGDTISICSENRLEFCLVPCAAFLSGITLAPLNPEYTVAEMHHTLGLSKPRVLFCSGGSGVMQRLAAVLPEHRYVEWLVVFDSAAVAAANMRQPRVLALQAALDGQTAATWQCPDVDTQETVATIMCSSGTTGMPKGVMTTQHNIITFLSLVRQITDAKLQEESDDISIGLVPFFHSMGFMIMMLALLGGRKTIIINKFQLRQFLQVLQDYKITILAVPPPIIAMLCNSPIVDEFDLSSIREIRCGAAPLAKEFEKKIAKKLRVKPVIQAYGMTETTLGVLFVPPSGAPLGSVGRVVPGMQAKVLGEGGVSLPAGHTGELCFRGPLIMRGYVADAEATAHTIDADGWLHTGDVGYYDHQRFFYIVDRIKELIKYKGWQVAPAELEALLLTHPAIVDAAVVGLPDSQAGELPLAYVVLRPQADVSSQTIQQWLKEQVSPHKQLRGGVRFIQAIPRNPSGKILRRLLKQMAINNQAKL